MLPSDPSAFPRLIYALAKFGFISIARFAQEISSLKFRRTPYSPEIVLRAHSFLGSTASTFLLASIACLSSSCNPSLTNEATAEFVGDEQSTALSWASAHVTSTVIKRIGEQKNT